MVPVTCGSSYKNKGVQEMLDAVIDEDAERLTKDMEENPGIAITIGNKLTEILGLTNTANLKKL